MEATTTTIATVISDQNNKENVPPICNTSKGKSLIPHTAPSFKNKKKCSKRKPKRVPLADITALINNSATSTFNLTHQQQSAVSALPSDPSISRRKTVTPAVPGSKALRMSFR
ncbi:hypothetical protein SESBI_17868 [Sesbania bispinosa]|nr:hypothetical protein SESBI_17868 [Sesbania bispinosa]